MVFTCANSLDLPPSIKYVATVNGAPAKPMSGTPSESNSTQACCTASITYGTCNSGVNGRKRSTSARVRNGCSITGPRPGSIEIPGTIACGEVMMSLKKIAASTPWRRTGCRVTSAAKAGSRMRSSKRLPARNARYSGNERPAWRINHTGVCAGFSPAHAAKNGEPTSASRVFTAINRTRL